MVTSSMVLFLAVASNVFGAVFTKLGTASVITDALVGLPLPDIWKLALIMLLIFVLGWPFEWPAIILVFLPIFLPVVEKLNFGLSKLDMLIWFGTLVAVNLQTAFLSPPVAMSAYYLKNVVPQWSLSTIYRGMADYMVIQIVCLLALIMWPQIALWLPSPEIDSHQPGAGPAARAFHKPSRPFPVSAGLPGWRHADRARLQGEIPANRELYRKNFGFRASASRF